MFYDIDTDESGIISCHEVEPLLTKVLGIKPTPVQLDNFIIALDEDGDGEISFGAFDDVGCVRCPVDPVDPVVVVESKTVDEQRDDCKLDTPWLGGACAH
jgi:hypothetical protein